MHVLGALVLAGLWASGGAAHVTQHRAVDFNATYISDKWDSFKDTLGDWVHRAIPGKVGPRFNEEGLIDVGTLGLDTRSTRLAAVGDYDGDQVTDLFLVSADRRSVSVWTWDRKGFTFSNSLRLELPRAADPIVNVIPLDVNRDARLDVLLVTSPSAGKKSWFSSGDPSARMSVYPCIQQDDRSLKLMDSMKIVLDGHSVEPLLVDAFGEGLVDFISKDNTTQGLGLWENVFADTNGTRLFRKGDINSVIESSQCVPIARHSNSFVDLDGDCLADVFLMCENDTFEIWLNRKGSFEKGPSGSLPKGTRDVSFSDVDRDGAIDMVLTVCETPDSCYVGVAYNKQMSVCSSREEHSCRSSEGLCEADPNFSFDFEDPSAYVAIADAAMTNGFPFVATLDDSSTVAPWPSLGDFNLDGFPDFLVIVRDPNDSTKQYVKLLMSQPCTTSLCGAEATAMRRRQFASDETFSTFALRAGITSALSASWINLDDDGSLDIVVQQRSSASRPLVFFYNNYYLDAFFLKLLALNGACQGSQCIPDDASSANISKYPAYAGAAIGATYKLTVFDPTGSRRSAHVPQLAKTSHFSMTPPYAFVGLGRTNNYVENLYAGSTYNQRLHALKLEGLIPNSQIIINMYEDSDIPDPSSWTREMYVHPGELIPWVTLALSVLVAFLGAIVLFLQHRERKEDDRERKRQVTQLNFSAL